MANKKIIPVVDALKELYGKLGGTPADVEDISTTTEIIQEIADVATPGGGGGGGSTDIFTVGMTAETTEETVVVTLDKTWQEIFNAVNSNKFVVLVSHYFFDGGELNYYSNSINLSYLDNIQEDDVENIFGAEFISSIWDGGFICQNANEYPSREIYI